jgi:hypothetical protein
MVPIRSSKYLFRTFRIRSPWLPFSALYIMEAKRNLIIWLYNVKCYVIQYCTCHTFVQQDTYLLQYTNLCKNLWKSCTIGWVDVGTIGQKSGGYMLSFIQTKVRKIEKNNFWNQSRFLKRKKVSANLGLDLL